MLIASDLTEPVELLQSLGSADMGVSGLELRTASISMTTVSTSSHVKESVDTLRSRVNYDFFCVITNI